MVILMVLAWLGLPSGVLTATAASSTVTVNAVADAYVSSSSPTSNFGASDPLQVSQNTYHVLLRFDLSLPAGSTITSATLRVYSNSSLSANLIVHPSTTTWVEKHGYVGQSTGVG